MRRALAGAVVAVSLALAACADEHGYPSAVRDGFVTSCAADGTPGRVCGCMLSRVEKKIPYAQFKAINDRYVSLDNLTAHQLDVFDAALYACTAS